MKFQNGAEITSQVGAYNTYVGARYVPKLDGQWDNSKNYEPLTIVINQGNSYTSAQSVPAGTPLQDNGPFWFLTGNYNGQIAHLTDQVDQINDMVIKNNVSINILDNKAFVSVKDYGAVGDGETDDTQAFQKAFDSGYNVYVPFNKGETYIITSTVTSNVIGQTLFSLPDAQGGMGGIHVDSNNFEGGIVFNFKGGNNVISNIKIRDTSLAKTLTGIKISRADNRSDIDSFVNNCYLSFLKYGVVISGRGIGVTNCLFGAVQNCLVCEWGNYVNTDQAQTQPYGFRGIRFLHNRCHTASYLVVLSPGTSGIIARDIIIANNQADFGGQLLFNSSPIDVIDSLISNNVVTESQNYIINVDRMIGCSIVNNVFTCINTTGDNGVFANVMHDCIFNNNVINGLARNVFVLKDVHNVIVSGNQFINNGKDSPSNRSIFQLTKVRGLIVRDNVFVGTADTTNKIVILISPTEITNLRINNNLINSFVSGLSDAQKTQWLTEALNNVIEEKSA